MKAISDEEIPGWYMCSKCESLHPTKKDAEKCCSKDEVDIEKAHNRRLI